MTAAVFDDRLFVDSVMTRINLEPLPTPARALGNALRLRDPAVAVGAVWTAWHLTTSNKLVVQAGTRVRNAALLAVLALLLAISTVLAGAGVTSVVRIIIDGPSPFHSVNNDGASNDQGGAVPPAFTEPSEEPTGNPTETPGHTPAITPKDDGDRPTAGPDEDNPGDVDQGDDDSGGTGGSGGGTHDGGDDNGGNGGGEDNGGGGSSGGGGGDEDNGGSGGGSGDDNGGGSGGGGQGDEASPGPSDDPSAGEEGNQGGGEPSPAPTSGDQGGDSHK